jgi:glycosyltransferase involved in cell wall biosynthesis
MDQPNATVSIVLATLNGAPFLKEQLASILEQDHTAWDVILSDDGSHDATLQIAKSMLDQTRLKILEGPKRGLAQNFWNGLKHVPREHFAAFCDQDDVWHSNKLARAVSHLSDIKGPALYTAGRIVAHCDMRTQYVQTRRSVSAFSSLLFRNPVAGNMCVLNPDAVKILQRFAPPPDVPFHDWWAALFLKGVGAEFIHDSTPTLRYRQHANNVIGARNGHLHRVLNGTYFCWIQSNIDGLSHIQDQLTPSARRVLRVCLPSRAGLRLGQRQKTDGTC